MNITILPSIDVLTNNFDYEKLSNSPTRQSGQCRSATLRANRSITPINSLRLFEFDVPLQHRAFILTEGSMPSAILSWSTD